MKLASKPVGLPAIVSQDLVSQIARALTNAIISGQLAPGAKVAEAAVARELGVSRAPVREAGRLLESQGLLTSIPGRGFFVRAHAPVEIDDLYDLRICIEKHAAVEAAKRLTPEGRAALRRQLDVLYEMAEINDPARQVEEDYRFHRLICEMSGNKRLLRLFDDLASELRIVIGLIGRLYDDPHRIAETHEPLLLAIESRDVAKIHASVEYHLGVAWRGVAQLVRNLPADQKTEKAL